MTFLQLTERRMPFLYEFIVMMSSVVNAIQFFPKGPGTYSSRFDKDRTFNILFIYVLDRDKEGEWGRQEGERGDGETPAVLLHHWRSFPLKWRLGT